MRRRNFLQKGLAATASAFVAGQTLAGTDDKHERSVPPAKTFNLNYAPHDGMFANHAGKNFIDQIRFMHEQGFRSIEDNGLLKRPVDEQEKIGSELAKLGMTMGVFVVDGGDNWKVSLATGKPEFVDTFVKTCKVCVEAAKRVN